MEDKTLLSPASVPAPEPKTNNEEREEVITAENIFNEVTSVDESGHAPCVIMATIEQLHDVNEKMEVVDIPEENRELLEDLELKFCKVSLSTLDNAIINVVLQFDSPEDAYKKDLLEMLDRYKSIMEDVTRDESGNMSLPMFSIAFAPDRYAGRAALVFSFPITYFKTLDEEDQATCIQLMFYADNMNYQLLSISDDDLADFEAELMREAEEKERLDEAYRK